MDGWIWRYDRACGEHTSLRDHQDFEACCMGRCPVLQVKVICCLDQNGIFDTSTVNFKRRIIAWIIKSRGPNRYVEDSWHDPENGEMVSSTSVGRPHAKIASTEESHASQPQAQWNLMNYFSEDFLRIETWKWNAIAAKGTVERKSLECRSRKWFKFWYHIVTLTIEKQMEEPIEILCGRSTEMRFTVKARKTFSDFSMAGLFPQKMQ